MRSEEAIATRESATDEDNRQDEQRDDAPRDEPPLDPRAEPNYYAVLGVSPFASREQVRAAYRRRIKLWHPDRYAGKPRSLRMRAEQRTRRLTAAWAVLGDRAKRQAYDQRRGFLRASAFDPFETTYDAWHGVSPTHASYRPPQTEERTENGAGLFAGALAVMLGIALLGGAAAGARNGIGPLEILVGIGVLGLLVLAGFLFTGESAPARMVQGWMEGEPRGHQVRYENVREDVRQAEPGTTSEEADAHADLFERAVDEALDTLPEMFREEMGNLVVRVEDEPSEETLREANVPPGHSLLGLYHGVPLTKQGFAGAGPEVVSIYRGPIERYCHGDPERIRDQVHSTVLHEIAHHFGIDHDDMPEWVK
jgi:predicted Zn-dependent protease with MMP-like domain